MQKHLLTLLLILIAATTTQAGRIRVACVGNSITYGAGIADRDRNSYPAQLQACLGEEYDVRNFGVSGATLSSAGDYPYVRTAAYDSSMAFSPDIVLIKLGTNDTKPQNWRHCEAYRADYQRLIDRYRSLPSRPRIILLTPVRCFLEPGAEISAALIADSVGPAVKALAYSNGLEVIDLYPLFGDRWEAALMPDRLHPSAIGAGRMAEKIGGYLLAPRADGHSAITISGAVPFDFHGYSGLSYETDGLHCLLVRPRREAPGRPWVLRARFWGHEPQTDIALLERGFHIAYCDVADLYGAPAAVSRWDRFYRHMRRLGFNRKVVLEGMSRGGLIVYNWAVRNVARVACVYADAPVMDFKSWPMGDGASAGSPADTEKLLRAYGFANASQARAWRRQPLDAARRLAHAGIPCLHVVGDADDVVPVDENTALFEQAMARHGCPATVIHKPGVGHHPHSLSDPAPIVNFILKATGLYSNPCVRAVPGNEFRAGAGWKAGAEWHAVSADIRQTLAGRHLRLLLLGNSIMQGWGGRRSLVTHAPGRAVLDSLLADSWETAGISGDRTQNLLWRLRHDGYATARPDNVVIAIGVNNVIAGTDSPADIAAGIIAVTEEAERVFPDAHIVLLGLLPTGADPQGCDRRAYEEIQRLLSRHRFSRARHVVPTAWFTDAAGRLREGLYSADTIHLTAAGYSRWAHCLAALLQ